MEHRQLNWHWYTQDLEDAATKAGIPVTEELAEFIEDNLEPLNQAVFEILDQYAAEYADNNNQGE